MKGTSDMALEIPRAVISASSSDSGKTLVTAAILRLLTRRGLRVQPFKVGPDFIDPMYHAIAAGRPSRNLDSWMMDEETIRRSFAEGAVTADLAIVEGVRGMYEGASSLGEEGSTAHVAKIIRAPVIVVMNSRSITRSAAAYILGLREFDRGVNIKGVILNKVKDARHEEKLREAIVHYTGIPVLGTLYMDASLSVKKRHLGLLTAHENKYTPEILDQAADALEESLDIERMIGIMEEAPPMPVAPALDSKAAESRVKIGVFKDMAFSFYYPENFATLERNGAELCWVDSIADAHLPAGVSGLLIGGGYPEVYAKELEVNASLRREVRKKAHDGMPIIGECGGLIYLCRSLAWGRRRRKMAGVFEGEAEMHERPQGLSYVLLEGATQSVLGIPGEKIKGHEFHYADVHGLERESFAFRVVRGKGISGQRDGAMSGQTIGMFTHLHYYASPRPAKRFVEACVSYGRG